MIQTTAPFVIKPGSFVHRKPILEGALCHDKFVAKRATSTRVYYMDGGTERYINMTSVMLVCDTAMEAADVDTLSDIQRNSIAQATKAVKDRIAVDLQLLVARSEN